jgi:hypothetical protein
MALLTVSRGSSLMALSEKGGEESKARVEEDKS